MDIFKPIVTNQLTSYCRDFVLLFLQELAAGVTAWYTSKAEADEVILEEKKLIMLITQLLTTGGRFGLTEFLPVKRWSEERKPDQQHRFAAAAQSILSVCGTLSTMLLFLFF